MGNFLNIVWQGILVYFRVLGTVLFFPFKLIWNILTFPFRLGEKFKNFLNEVPDERPITEVFTDLATDQNTRAGLWEQVEDLRNHLIRSVVVLVLIVAGIFLVAQDIMAFIAKPVGGLANLQAIQVTEEIGVFMTVSITVGIAIAFPYLAFEAWLFAAPGLRPREKKLGLMGIPVASVLFLLGMIFTYYVLLPAALPFLGGFTEISQVWTAKEYFSFVTSLMLWLGVFFEFPLVIYVLTAVGLVKPQILLEQWRIAIVVIAILAAVVTPTPDPINMGLVMLPMILLYFVSIGLSQIAYARRKKNDEETGAG